MTNYEMNQQVVKQKEPLSASEIEQKKPLLTDFAKAHNKYFMLLCRDTYYFTLFVKGSDGTKFCDDVIECAQTQGQIKAIDLADVIEIWVETPEEEPRVMYLFPYDEGVIECQA